MWPPPTVQARVARIATDTEHGASWLARAALLAVAESAPELRAPAVAETLRALDVCIGALMVARAGMAAPRVWLGRLGREIDAEAGRAADGAALAEMAAARAMALLAAAEEAERAVAERAAAAIPPGAVVMTASYSGTVLGALLLAHERISRVLAAESRAPDGSRGYGAALVERLEAGGVAADVVPDAEIPRRVREATLVLLGADTLLPDGSLINGAPSFRLCRGALAAGVPVLVACESAKRDAPHEPTNPVLPTGFELIPAALVSRVITEEPADDAV